MKKLFLSFLAVFTLLFAFSPLAKAEVPSGVFGFMDGKFYDSTSALKYLCFMDNKCYDLNGVFSFNRAVVSAPVTDEFKTDCEDPLNKFKSDMAVLKSEYNTKYQAIIANTQGTFGGSVEAAVQSLDSQYNPKFHTIETKRNALANECHSDYPDNLLPNLY